MRKLKFRAWDKKRRRMFSPRAIRFSGSFVWVHGYSIDDVEIMQFTGLCDKNGKEIYEGDIILWKWGNSGDDGRQQSVVVWDESYCGFQPWVNYDSDCQIFGGADPGVIGNIYEHPELVKP